MFFFKNSLKLKYICIKNELFDANIELAYLYNKIFNPVNLVFLFLSMQYIRLTTYCHIFVKQLMTDFNHIYYQRMATIQLNIQHSLKWTHKNSLPVLTTLTSVQNIRCSHLSHCTHITIIKETLFLTASG